MKTMFEVRLVVDIPPTVDSQLENKLQLCQNMARKYLEACGVDVVNASYNTRKLLKEERMTMVPPSVHHVGPKMITACGRLTARKATTSWDKVTCKPCLKNKPKSDQGELF